LLASTPIDVATS